MHSVQRCNSLLIPEQGLIIRRLFQFLLVFYLRTEIDYYEVLAIMPDFYVRAREVIIA